MSQKNISKKQTNFIFYEKELLLKNDLQNRHALENKVLTNKLRTTFFPSLNLILNSWSSPPAYVLFFRIQSTDDVNSSNI
jgi:hypothetical protein